MQMKTTTADASEALPIVAACVVAWMSQKVRSVDKTMRV